MVAKNITCPFCGQMPEQHHDKVYCVNNLCPIYLILVPRNMWNMEMGRRNMRKELAVMRKLLMETLGE